MTRLVCHRGASLHAPENSFAAAAAALEMGADVIELDVRESADGVLYVLHDRAVDRTTDGHGLIDLMHSSEIDALDAGRWFAPEFEGARVPRLDAYLDFLTERGAGAYVEIKWCTPERAASIIREAGMEDTSFSFSFRPEMREGMRLAAPHLRRMIALSIARTVGVARSIHHADTVEMEIDELRPAVTDAARTSGLEIMAYTESGEVSVIETALKADIDYLNHDHIAISSRLTGRMK